MQWVSSVCLSFLWDPLINIQQKLSCKSTVVKSYIPWYIYLQTFCPSGQYNITGFVYGSILIINLLFHQIRYKNVLRQYPFLATKVETQKLSLPRKGKKKIFYSQLFRSKKKVIFRTLRTFWTTIPNPSWALEPWSETLRRPQNVLTWIVSWPHDPARLA